MLASLIAGRRSHSGAALCVALIAALQDARSDAWPAVLIVLGGSVLLAWLCI